MKKTLYTLVAVAIAGLSFTTPQTPVTWKLDPVHSSINFSATHMVVSEVTGSFKKFDGVITSKDDNFTDTQVEFTIDVNSISTDNEKRDEHLKSDDFFNAAKYPHIKFKGKSLKKINGNKYVLNGDLTVRDITKPVDLAVIYNGTIKDPYGNIRAGFKVAGSINRMEYGLKWNALLEAGGAVVGSEIPFTAHVELIKQK